MGSYRLPVTAKLRWEELERRMRSFSREGWNGNGARLLAVACSLATARNSSLKMNFAGRDIFLLCVLLSLAIKFISSPIPALIAAAFSLSYIVKKLLGKTQAGGRGPTVGQGDAE